MLLGAAIAVRNSLYDSGLKRSSSLDIPVVCVGNITVGGMTLGGRMASAQGFSNFS